MGTKVHFKSFFPVGYSTMSLNEENDSGCWPLCYDDKLLKSRQCFNTFSPQPAIDVYLDNDKEVVKQTMLKHEAIFRKQVSELHRLYRMQRVLMEEMKRQEVHKFPITVEASHSNAFSSQKPFEDAKKMCLISCVSSVKSSCSRASVSGTENMHPHLNFSKQSSMKAESFPTENGGNFGECEIMESNTRKRSRRTFDLQLPADEYIDSEEGDQIEEENASQVSVVANNDFKRNWGVSPENGMKLFLSTDANLDCQGVVSNSASRLGNKSCLADLNQPIQVEEASSSASVNNFLGPVIYHGGIQGRDASLKKSSFLGFPGEIFQNTQQADKVEDSRHEWSSYKLHSGQSGIKINSFSQDLGSERFPYTSKIVNPEFKDTHAPPAFLLPDNSRGEPWNGNMVVGAVASERSQSIANHNLWGRVTAPPLPSQYLVVPDFSDSVSLSASSMRRPISTLSQNPDAVKGVDCFNPSAQSSKSSNASIQSPKFIEGKWHLDNHPRSNSSLGSEVLYRNGFLHGFLPESNASQAHLPWVGIDYLNCSSNNASAIEHFENHHNSKYFKGSVCKDVKSRKDMNLNPALPNGSQEGVIAQQDLILNGERKNEDSLGALPRFRTKVDPIQDSTSAPCTHNAEDLGIETSDCTGTKKIFGVPIVGKPHNSELFSQNCPTKTLGSLLERTAFQNSGKVKVLNIDLSQEPELSDSGQQLSMENMVVVKEPGEGLSGSRVHFDLNSCASEEDPLACLIPKDTVKIAGKIDLEVPPVPEIAEVMLPQKYLENQFKMPTQSSASEGGLQDPTRELIKVAAEALVVISSSVHNHSKDDTNHPRGADLNDSLHWFAEVVSSFDSEEGVNSRGKASFDIETYSSDESDYFERMTLNLAETKMDEYWCTKPGPENLNIEETVGSLLPTRRRRGQAKRGRQRKDFQRDILPGMVSLSRHEVTKDLQMIGELMRATGHPWQTALEQRNAARNGWARGRRRSRGSASSVTAVAACTPPQQQLDDNNNKNNNDNNNSNYNELGLEERSLRGWGKTTRRPRCQRFVAGNPPAVPLTQV